MPSRTTRLPALLIAAAAGLTARALYARLGRFEIAEASMTPSLLPGDYVLTDRTSRQLRRGDIAVFEHPDRPAFHLVKRIVGLPGEHLTIESGRVLIDGIPLSESWTNDDTGPDGTWELGAGEAFVLGDARSLSAADSRHLGPVPVERLRVKIVLRYWPPGRFGWVA